jgi:site-specific DNA recombinase
MFALYQKEHSLLRVVEQLNGQGSWTKTWTIRTGGVREGGLWGKWSLRCLLGNVTYAGQVEYGGEVFPGEHEAIIDAETFGKVGELLKQAHRDFGDSRNKHGFLLRGLLRCASCHSAMVSWATSSRRKKSYRYYTCARVNRHGTGECPVRSVSADAIEAFVVERIRGMGRDPGLVRDTIEAVLASRADDESALRTEDLRLEHQLSALRGEARQLVANLGEARGEGNRAILDRLSEVEMRAGQVGRRLAEIAEATAAIKVKPVTKEDVAGALGLFDPAWDGLVPREKAKLLRLLIDAVVYDGVAGQVAITWKPTGIATLAADVAGTGVMGPSAEGAGPDGDRERLLRQGDVESMADLARLGGVTPARITQISDLMLLAPDIQEALLSLAPVEHGHDPIHLREVRYVCQSPAWEEQRRRWAEIMEVYPLRL